MTKPQTAKDLVELYDEYKNDFDELAKNKFAVRAFNFGDFMDYLRNKQTVVVEDDWDDHKPQTVGVEFPPLSPLTYKEIELDNKLKEIIWYELGDGLNATDVDECVKSIKQIYADTHPLY